MNRLPLILAGAIVASIPAGAQADESKWSVSLYAGPSTNYIFTEVIAGRFHSADTMVGLAADRKLAYLGWGWSLEGDGQVRRF